MIYKTESSIEIVKKSDLRVPHRQQSGSILRFSSSFLFKIGIVRHFNTVNTSDMVESGYTRIRRIVFVNTLDTVEVRACADSTRVQLEERQGEAQTKRMYIYIYIYIGVYY